MNVRDFFVRMALFSFIIVGLAAKQEDHKMSKKVCIVGSGNWGTCVARRVALNILDLKDQAEKEELATEHKHASEMPTHFDEEVRMFVYEEMFEGRKLSEIINEQQENVKVPQYTHRILLSNLCYYLSSPPSSTFYHSHLTQVSARSQITQGSCGSARLA